MWPRRGVKKAGKGALRPGRFHFLACALVALVWLCGSSSVRLQDALAMARLRWYIQRGTQAAQPPSLHGPVQKAGPVDLRLFHPKLRESCYAERETWTDAAARGGDLRQAVQRAPCAECQVFVNHLYKLLYIRHPKVDASAVLARFGACTIDRSPSSEDRSGHNEGCLRLWEEDASPEERQEAGEDATSPPTLKKLAELSEEQVADVWREYFVFTSTRDPLSRAVSQYRHLMHTNYAEPKECFKAASALDWDSFCQAPLLLPQFCAVHPDCCEKGVVDGVWLKLAQLAPLAPCMTTPNGRLAVDFVVRQEHMEHDLAELMLHLNARQDVPELNLPQQIGAQSVLRRCPVQRVQAMPQHGVASFTWGTKTWLGITNKEQYCSTDDFYTSQHAHCRAAIATHFADDMSLLYLSRGKGAIKKWTP